MGPCCKACPGREVATRFECVSIGYDGVHRGRDDGTYARNRGQTTRCLVRLNAFGHRHRGARFWPRACRPVPPFPAELAWRLREWLSISSRGGRRRVCRCLPCPWRPRRRVLSHEHARRRGLTSLSYEEIPRPQNHSRRPLPSSPIVIATLTVVAGREPDWRCRRTDQHHRRTNQSAGAQCRHRGSTRWRRRSALRRGRIRGQGSGRADRKGNRRDKPADQRHQVATQGSVAAIKESARRK